MTTQPVSVTVNGDTAVEPNETFIVNLSGATNATIADGQGVGTIMNDDLPALSVNDVALAEGDSGTTSAVFTVSLSVASASTVTVGYEAQDGTANSGSDYIAAAGTLTFSPGATHGVVTVDLIGDTVPESDETFAVRLTSPSGATLGRDHGDGVIQNDDTSQADFDGDGRSDILWRHTDGTLQLWLMNGAVVGSSGPVSPMATTQEIAASGDFDGNGAADILWRERDSGATQLWFMNGLTVGASGATTTQYDRSWRLSGGGDLDGDRRTDVIWRHADGRRNVWLMEGLTIKSSTDLPSPPLNAEVLAVEDFDGDKSEDILWRVRGTGSLHLWLMDGTAVKEASVLLPEAASHWLVAGVGDLNGDGLADLVWRAATGGPLVWLMDGTGVAQSARLPSSRIPPVSRDWATSTAMGETTSYGAIASRARRLSG